VYDVDGHLTLYAYQRGAGTYTVSGEDTGTLAMTFDDSSDPGLEDDEMAFSFSEDHQQVTIDPTNIDFLLCFDRVD
jgi:hypothetical protein